MPYCTNSVLYVDFIHAIPRFGGYDTCLVVTCGLYRLNRVFPCNKKITGEQTVKMLVEQWFEPYGTPKQVHSDEDVRIRSETGWYKRVLNALNVEVTTGVGLLPILRALDAKKQIVGHTDHANTIYSICTLQNMPFFMKTCQKWPFCLSNIDFLALYRQLKDPPPILRVLDAKKASCGPT